jgi:hypothetical protein
LAFNEDACLAVIEADKFHESPTALKEMARGPTLTTIGSKSSAHAA